MDVWMLLPHHYITTLQSRRNGMTWNRHSSLPRIAYRILLMIKNITNNHKYWFINISLDLSLRGQKFLHSYFCPCRSWLQPPLKESYANSDFREFLHTMVLCVFLEPPFTVVWIFRVFFYLNNSVCTGWALDRLLSLILICGFTLLSSGHCFLLGYIFIWN